MRVKGKDGFYYDDIENDERVKKLLEQISTAMLDRCGGKSPGMGFCHLIWAEQKKVLKEQYGIEWMTPRECNPDWLFD